ncbi:MAG: hypothetical protein R2710_20615 [Acidimicrobiales bacterium]
MGVALSVGIHLWRELQVYIEVERTGDHLRISPHGVLWFGSINRISEKILAVIADHPRRRRCRDRTGRHRSA